MNNSADMEDEPEQEPETILDDQVVVPSTKFWNPLFKDNSIFHHLVSLTNMSPYHDTALVCSDGVVHHNRMFATLVFPQLVPSCSALHSEDEVTVLLPDYTTNNLKEIVEKVIDAKCGITTVTTSFGENMSQETTAATRAKNEPSMLCQIKMEHEERDDHNMGNDDDIENDDIEEDDDKNEEDENAGENENNTEREDVDNRPTMVKPFSISEMLSNLTPVSGGDVNNFPYKTPPDIPLPTDIPAMDYAQYQVKKAKKKARRKKKTEEEDVMDDNEVYFQAPPVAVTHDLKMVFKKKKERKRKDPNKPINPYKERDDMSKPYKPVKMTYRHLPKNLICTHCTYRTYHISNLTNHMRTHTGEKPYPCSFCGEKFRFSGVRNLHEKTHTGEKEYACQYCGKEFARRYVMILHERTHTGEKPFSCDFCGKRFTRHSTKINHEKGHKGSNSHGATVQESPDSADFDDKKRLSAILNSQGGGPNPDQKQRSLIQEHVTGGYEEKPRVLPDMSPYEDRHVYEERYTVKSPPPGSHYDIKPPNSVGSHGSQEQNTDLTAAHIQALERLHQEQQMPTPAHTQALERLAQRNSLFQLPSQFTQSHAFLQNYCNTSSSSSSSSSASKGHPSNHLAL